jgi:hypothetical protein
MRLPGKVIKSVIGMLVFCFTLCGSLPQAAAVPLSIGETVTFSFTLPAIDASQYGAISYVPNASAPNQLR